MKRKMYLNGTFYPNNKNELIKYIENFTNSIENNFYDKNILPKAIIVPHAGYIYSGYTANIAYNLIAKYIKPKRIIVIGPSHKFRFDGVSISFQNSYETPLGNLDIDNTYAKILENKFNFIGFLDTIHQEHSTETQMPFIKYYFPNTKIIEMIYGKCDYKNLSLVIDDILNNKDNLLVISTDLSHFYPLDKAKQLDQICLNSIQNFDLSLDKQGCEACGMVGVKALLNSAKKSKLNIKLLDYKTSANINKDNSSVVGYGSWILNQSN